MGPLLARGRNRERRNVDCLARIQNHVVQSKVTAVTCIRAGTLNRTSCIGRVIDTEITGRT